jgi:hypothetical protein
MDQPQARWKAILRSGHMRGFQDRIKDIVHRHESDHR